MAGPAPVLPSRMPAALLAVRLYSRSYERRCWGSRYGMRPLAVEVVNLVAALFPRHSFYIPPRSEVVLICWWATFT